MAQFHEVSLPMPLALAASGGPERRVEVVPLAGGGEARNAIWAGSRRRWEIGSSVTDVPTLQGLTAFFEARGGRLHGFRFRDRIDDRSGSPGAAVTPLDQVIAAGDGETASFALVKTYGDWRRRIWKPVPGSVLVAVDGVEVAASADAATGTVTLAEPPETGAAVTAGYVFDCPVRFDTDRLDINLEAFGAGRVIRIPLVELIG
ncbi:MAG: TIGR02217 family protein [Hyphomonas sp.]